MGVLAVSGAPEYQVGTLNIQVGLLLGRLNKVPGGNHKTPHDNPTTRSKDLFHSCDMSEEPPEPPEPPNLGICTVNPELVTVTILLTNVAQIRNVTG